MDLGGGLRHGHRHVVVRAARSAIVPCTMLVQGPLFIPAVPVGGPGRRAFHGLYMWGLLVAGCQAHASICALHPRRYGKIWYKYDEDDDLGSALVDRSNNEKIVRRISVCGAADGWRWLIQLWGACLLLERKTRHIVSCSAAFFCHSPMLMRGLCAAQTKWLDLLKKGYLPRPTQPGEVSAFKGVGKLEDELWASTSCDVTNPEYYGTCAAPPSAALAEVCLRQIVACACGTCACACGTRLVQACELRPARAAMPCSPAETARSRRSFGTEEEAVMAYDVVGLARGRPPADLHGPIAACAQRQPAWCFCTALGRAAVREFK